MNRIVIIMLLLLGSTAGFTQTTGKTSEARDRLSDAGAVWRAESAGYFSVRFDRPLSFSTTKPEVAARDFLTEYGAAIALDDFNDLTLVHRNKGIDGRYYLRYRQLRDGTPVLGGEITLEMGTDGAVRGLAGSLLPEAFFAPATPPPNGTRPAAFFHQRATAALRDRYPFAHQWEVAEQAPIWVSRNPWQPAANQPVHLTRTFTVTEPAGFQQEMVYLDAATGELIFSHQLHCDLNRRLYHSIPTSSNIVWQEGDQFPGSLSHEDQELLMATSDTYSLFARTFDRQSFDDQNGQMRGITNARLVNCPNANAGANIIRICQGVVADDVVAHEWTHSYIFDMNGLIYAFESGAINEGLADVFGESIDLLNGRGTDTNDHLPRTACDENNFRWKIAEDADSLDGYLRDLWQPECKEHASNRDSPFFACLPENEDSGGVHINSGLVNRTFSLLTDGGILNGDTVSGIGLTKALHIFHHANANYITRVTDFFAFGDMLALSAYDLMGTDLPALTVVNLPVPFSGEVIDSADIIELEKAIHATQLRGEGPCINFPVLAQNPPSLCETALLPDLVPLLEQDWEDSLGAWTVTETAVSEMTWDDKPWRISGNLPDGRPGLGAFAPNPTVGDCQLDLDNGVVALTSPVISLPVGESDFRLSFDHYFALQEDFDGGVLYLARNGGDFQAIPDSAFLYNGYNGQLKNNFENDNPLAGARAFHGADGRSTSGSWGRSIVDLALAGAYESDDIQLRWTLGHDGCDGWLGWFLDDVRIGYCGEVALPVAFLSFTTTPAKDHVRLVWATTEDDANAGFYPERRDAAGGGFRELGFVSAGSGNYTFTDSNVLPGAAYVYRLRQVATDGTERYSTLITARIPAEGGLLAYPNPVREMLTISAPPNEGTAELYDGRGRLTASAKLSGGKGLISTTALPSGVYYLRVGALVRRVVR